MKKFAGFLKRAADAYIDAYFALMFAVLPKSLKDKVLAECPADALPDDYAAA